jgi:hypothetical protein
MPEDGTLHDHRCENLTSYTSIFPSQFVRRSSGRLCGTAEKRWFFILVAEWRINNQSQLKAIHCYKMFTWEPKEDEIGGICSMEIMKRS